ncbi:MAG: class I SAM-dependent methyltransferase [Krumholzibacteria bacterium]|nr:class I SAM-dependent methyltransferase [Candidatus Krumholzibacteria bacterium]
MNDRLDIVAVPTRGQRLCRRLLLGALAGIEGGRLVLRDGDGRHAAGHGAGIELHVLDGSFYPAALWGQSSGVGRAYAQGWWTCSDPVGLVRLLARNEPVIRRWTAPTLGVLAPWHRARLWRSRNTEARARRNILAHYDLGNDFFAAFLDPGMTYSCAVFAEPGESLQEAQTNKLDRICRKLELGPQDHVLEIGTGWGSFALHAAANHGCRVTTTTISAEQAALARERVRRAGLADRVTVLEEDYRRLTGAYDKLVSIEMIEAVGVRYFPAYFRACSRLLRPDGAMLLQAIVVDDRHFRHDAHHEDFIKRWIFPGGVLPSVGEIARRVAADTDLQLAHLEDLTSHYAETLRRWHENLRAAWDQLAAAGRDEAFLRAWEFYFHYCRGGFLERRVGVVQTVLVKPRCQGLGLLQPQAATWPGTALRREACHG